MKITKAALSAFLTIALVSVLVGTGTFAYFTDSEMSSNTLESGTMDLKINDADPDEWTDGVTATWFLSNMQPGDAKMGSVLMKNNGNLDADHLEITCDYTVTEELPRLESDTDWDTNLNPDSFAKEMIIVEAEYNNGKRIDLLTGNVQQMVPSLEYNNPLWKMNDANGDGLITIYEFMMDDLNNLPAPNGHQYTFYMKVKFDENANNDFQGDTLNLEVTFTLNQDSSQSNAPIVP